VAIPAAAAMELPPRERRLRQRIDYLLRRIARQRATILELETALRRAERRCGNAAPDAATPAAGRGRVRDAAGAAPRQVGKRERKARREG
jgi:hypothetical protein